MGYSTLLKDDDRNMLLRAMQRIGTYQCAQQARAKTSARTKIDGSIVTDIDKASQDQLIEALRQIEPHYPVLSEEREHSKNMRAMKHDGPIWVVDPLDGTKSYSEGYDEFGINVALLSAPAADGNRTAVFGAAYFPAKHELYFTSTHGTSVSVTFREDGSIDETKPLRCTRSVLPESPLRIAIGYNDSGLPHFDTSGHAITASKHTGGYRTARVLKDGYHAACFEAPAAIWDIAALDALVRGAGGNMFSIHADGTVTDTPYFGADATRYHAGKLFANPPYICMHKSLLEKTDLAQPAIGTRTGHQR